MREFKQSQKLNNVCYDIRGAVMDEAARLTAQGHEILKLNIGNPAPFRLFAPTYVTDTMSSYLPETEGYSDSKGILSARRAIAKYFTEKKHIQGVTEDDIYTGNGVSELITMVMQGLLDSGDEILLPAPDYPLWTASVSLAGGTPVHYLCDEKSNWYPDINDIKRKITSNTKGIVIINPNNPTGALYPDDVLLQIVELAREHELIIFSDEIYDRLVMDGKTHTSIASLAPDVFCITMNGLSKSHMVAGYRIGWMCLSGPKDHVKDYIEGLNLLSSMRLCSNVPAQSIVEKALESYPDENPLLMPGGRVYEQRMLTWKRMNDIPGVSCVKPEAAFYAFPCLDMKKFNLTDDMKFAADFLHDEHVLIVQGTGFNWPDPNHFRIVYLPEINVLDEAYNKLEHFLSYYHQ